MKTQIKNLMSIGLLVILCIALTQCSIESNSETEAPLTENFSKAKVNNDEGFKFVTHLSGENEKHDVDSKATGQAIVEISDDESMIYYKLIVANIENVLQSHFHNNVAGENGPVVSFLFAGPKKEGRFGGVLSEGYITEADLIVRPNVQNFADLIEAIRNGAIYINVHTDQYGNGELRGQL